MTRDPTWKALPTHKIPERILELRVVKRKGAAQTLSLHLIGLRALRVSIPYAVDAYGQQWSMGILCPHRVRYPRDSNKKLFSHWDLEDFERCVAALICLLPRISIVRL